MDQDSLRALATLLVFITFITLSFSVFRKSRKAYFEDAALLPFADDELGRSVSHTKKVESSNE
ncbi:cbb3-type cytochrome oxidase subunit 3 [Zhongshania marina]|uniref:CcoQ/FixQ family Cbb3-type cytochrome c oxidase assembly chaperone n=1 Tax=Zhongshania marina TaxID=2304603 RepID=A0A2S4HBN2_9GAMM|nr:cbb3-type cytochrome c oxidase subunit 3 [Marortus luteolus]POP51349.1 CcoQ/FixQ family Cbb3-type cytochrome c oxidase assembly chaperone [Marortus luteolus]